MPSPSPSPSPSPPAARATTVLMMRNCIRSIDDATTDDAIYDVPQLSDYDDYSKKSWPKFDVALMHCLDQGETIVEESGKWYKEHGDLPSPVSVVADDCRRDLTTGKAFLQGLGLEINDKTFATDVGPFSSLETTGTELCPRFTFEERDKVLQDQLEKNPLDKDLEKLMTEVYQLAGEGKAGDWTQHACELRGGLLQDWWAPLKGGCNVAAAFSERFLMESGGGADQELAWGKLKPEDVPKFLALHAWFMQVTMSAKALEKKRQASIAWAILEALEAKAPGTTAFVGHGSQQAGLNAILGLNWSPSPWPQSGTMPGGALRFDLEPGSDTVKISYVFVEDFTKGGGVMKSVPVNVGDYPQGTVSLSNLRKLVEENTVAACRTDKPAEQIML